MLHMKGVLQKLAWFSHDILLSFKFFSDRNTRLTLIFIIGLFSGLLKPSPGSVYLFCMSVLEPFQKRSGVNSGFGGKDKAFTVFLVA